MNVCNLYDKMNLEVKNILKNRKIVADSIFAVLTHRMCVREALMSFPTVEEDRTLDAAWHALVHYEADEELRRRDPEYAQTQDEYLEFLAFKLSNGENIPLNIIADYDEFYVESPTPKKNGAKNLWGIFRRILNI